MPTTITEPGAYPPVTTQAPDAGVAVSDYVTGTCVSLGSTRRGRVVEIIPPLRYSGQHGNRYRIVDADDRTHHVDGVRKIDPTAAALAAAIVAAATTRRPSEAAAAALAAARDAGAGQHLAAKLARTAYDRAGAILAAYTVTTTDGDTVTTWDRDTEALTDVWHCRGGREFGALTLAEIVEHFGTVTPVDDDQ